MTGRSGRDLIVRVPPGTLIYDRDTNWLLKDLDVPNHRVCIARGGRGGKGNAHFATSRHQTPRFSQEGEDPEERWLRLELKLASAWWRRYRQSGRNQWTVDLVAEYQNYWSTLIGTVEVAQMDELTLIEQVELNRGGAPKQISRNQALAAYRTWRVIQTVGHREAQASMPRPTWYLHKQILFKAGFSWSDFATGAVDPVRRRRLALEQPVKSWAAAAHRRTESGPVVREARALESCQ